MKIFVAQNNAGDVNEFLTFSFFSLYEYIESETVDLHQIESNLIELQHKYSPQAL